MSAGRAAAITVISNELNELLASGPMDRATVEEQLARAELRVTLAEAHVARQTKLLAKLEFEGDNKREARVLLALTEKTLAMRVADRDLFRKQLAGMKEG